ncbi:MAG: 2-amino-4-hydroxy-6-hydroxymethyldihydropteridine diphosphokinase [Bacteroidaceae bacterium]|nr:2-amino-4-hydroxy-6-hydroxymethyldihydropteridine diphosphokinase [Bacteroidaceae bacterium]
MKKESFHIYLGLGTNQGDKEKNLKRAIELLSLALGKYTLLSSFIETEPWGFESQNSFLNCVVTFTTTLTPFELLEKTEKIERELGRVTKSQNGTYHDRIIDIDILFYGEKIIQTKRLTIPHPLIQERDFVLNPLFEIAPQLIHPIVGKTIAELKEEVNKKQL